MISTHQQSSSSRQQTVAQSFTLEGIGIHTGAFCRVRVHPAPPGSGRVFRVGDIAIPARTEYVVDTTRCTTLANGNARVHTVEHLLSALHGYSIDNVYMEVEGPELPILDGSALEYARAIETSGILAQEFAPRVLTLARPLALNIGPTQFTVEPANGLEIEARTEFADWPEGNATVVFSNIYSTVFSTVFSIDAADQQMASIGLQAADTQQTTRLGATLDTLKDLNTLDTLEGNALPAVAPSNASGEPCNPYRQQIAPARTFAFQQEVDRLLAAGLARGGSLENALIITPPDTFSSPLRLPHEWCAHKVLDMLGDLALIDARINVRVRALRPGHTGNVTLAHALREQGIVND